MDRQDLERRGEIAMRLKAARWIAGTIERPEGRSPKPVALPIPDLAKRRPLPENNITASLLGTIERMERHTMPMELNAIAEALNLPGWFGTGTASPDAVSRSVDDLLRGVASAAQEPPQAPGESREGSDGDDHPPAVSGGGV